MLREGAPGRPSSQAWRPNGVHGGRPALLVPSNTPPLHNDGDCHCGCRPARLDARGRLLTMLTSIPILFFRGLPLRGGPSPCDKAGRWLYYWKDEEAVISKAQRRAIQNYRSRLGERGLARFEVLGRDGDQDLIRLLARKLAEDTSEASQLRTTVSRSIAGEPPRKGGILAALRRSPLVGADIDLTRPRDNGRKVDL
jgi:hypothetical protein